MSGTKLLLTLPVGIHLGGTEAFCLGESGALAEGVKGVGEKFFLPLTVDPLPGLLL